MLRDGQFWGCFGVMGGFMQPQGHFQVVSALLDDGLNPQEALDRPRWMVADGQANGDLLLEEGIPVGTMAALAERGALPRSCPAPTEDYRHQGDSRSCGKRRD